MRLFFVFVVLRSITVDTTVIFSSTSTSTVSATEFATSLSSSPSSIFTDASFADYGTISAASVVISYSSPTTSPTTLWPTAASPHSPTSAAAPSTRPPLEGE